MAKQSSVCLVPVVLFSDGTSLFSCSTCRNISGVSCLIENHAKLYPGYSPWTTRRRLSMFFGVIIGTTIDKRSVEAGTVADVMSCVQRTDYTQ